MALSNNGRIRVNVTGARGALGIDLQGAPAPGQYIVKGPGGGRSFSAVTPPGEISDAVALTDLASGTGSNLVGFGGESLYSRLARQAFVTDSRFSGGAKGDDTTDDAPAIQAAIDALAGSGGEVIIPRGKFRINSKLIMRSGVSLRGEGSFYRFVSGNEFYGTWLRYTGPTSDRAIECRSVQDVAIRDLGINMGERPSSEAILIGSDNNPACKRLNFHRLHVFGATLGVRWGLSNELNPLEQNDEIVFDVISFNSCNNGFRIDSANAADFSRISSASFGNLTGVAFDLISPGFMQIVDCAAGFVTTSAVMFKIAGSSPDPLRISGCQSEGANGKFLTYNSANDQGTVILEGNVINQPIEVSGITKIFSTGNYYNSTVSLSGFVRYNSVSDTWDGVNGAVAHEPQFIIGSGVNLKVSVQRNASNYNGRFLPVGFYIDRPAPVAGAFEKDVIVQPGIVGIGFVPGGQFDAGTYVVPTIGNGHAYLVTVGGVAGSEPSFPTGSGAEVTSGTVTFKEVGVSAIVRGCSPIQA